MYTFLILLLLLLPLPLYWIFKATLKIEKNQKRTLSAKDRHCQMIKRIGLPISSIAVLNNAIIGLDYKNNKIIWASHRDHGIRTNCILLKDIRFCKVDQEKDTLSGCTKKVVMKIDFDTGKAPVCFTFFDDAIDPIFALPSRLKNANYWKSKIQIQINRNKSGLVLEYVL